MELSELATSVVDACKSYVSRVMKDLGARMDSLQAQIEERKAKDAERDAAAESFARATGGSIKQTGDLIHVLVEDHKQLRERAEAMIEEVKALRAAPVSPASFMVDGDGCLVSVYPDGSTKEVGKVRGEDGKRGAAVMDCSIDDAGMLSLRMSDGRVLNAGIVRGEAGKPGKNGEGKPGRDAAELKIAAGIDDSKSYPEGTCAAYRGGVVRAERSTQPLASVPDLQTSGWTVILEGIAEETEDTIDSGRFVERTTTYTSGKTFKRRAPSAMMIYRGVWAEQQYTKGDAATWNGSLWHCERPTKAKPGTCEDWKLVAKAGRDANPTKH